MYNVCTCVIMQVSNTSFKNIWHFEEEPINYKMILIRYEHYKNRNVIVIKIDQQCTYLYLFVWTL